MRTLTHKRVAKGASHLSRGSHAGPSQQASTGEVVLTDISVTNKTRGEQSTAVVTAEGIGFGTFSETFTLELNGVPEKDVTITRAGGEIRDTDISFTVPDTANVGIALGPVSTAFTTTAPDDGGGGGDGGGDDGGGGGDDGGTGGDDGGLTHNELRVTGVDFTKQSNGNVEIVYTVENGTSSRRFVNGEVFRNGEFEESNATYVEVGESQTRTATRLAQNFEGAFENNCRNEWRLTVTAGDLSVYDQIVGTVGSGDLCGADTGGGGDNGGTGGGDNGGDNGGTGGGDNGGTGGGDNGGTGGGSGTGLLGSTVSIAGLQVPVVLFIAAPVAVVAFLAGAF